MAYIVLLFEELMPRSCLFCVLVSMTVSTHHRPKLIDLVGIYKTVVRHINREPKLQ